MTVGSNETYYYDPSDPISRLDSLETVTLQKMATLRQEFERRDAELTKAGIPDLVKAQQRLALAEATEQLMDDIQAEAFAEVERIKQMPAPAKGIVASNPLIEKSFHSGGG